MSHELETGFFVRQKAWHGLGTVLDNAPKDTAEAMTLAGLDWHVTPMPVYSERMTTDGMQRLDAENHRAMVRSSDGKILSVMTDSYTPLQNLDAFRFFEPFLHEGDAHLEAAGSLKGGRTVWVLAKIGNDDYVANPNDRLAPYLLLSNSHDGSSCVSVAFTAIRVVCWNTLSAALGREKASTAKVRHTRNVKTNVTAVRNCIDLARREFTVTLDLLTGMRKREIDIPTLRAYVQQLFGTPAKLAEIAKAQAETPWDVPKVKGEDAVMDLFYSGPGAELAGRTVYGAYNAVTHYLDHVRGGDDNDKRLNSTWFGQGAKVRDEAFRLAVAASE